VVDNKKAEGSKGDGYGNEGVVRKRPMAQPAIAIAMAMRVVVERR
jgi:hypothetical protein